MEPQSRRPTPSFAPPLRPVAVPDPVHHHHFHKPDWRRQIPLPMWAKAAMVVVGWVLVLVGIAGLFLPILQGFLFLIPGLALLSIASESFHRFLRARFARWPRGWRRVLKLRRRLETRILHLVHRDRRRQPR